METSPTNKIVLKAMDDVGDIGLDVIQLDRNFMANPSLFEQRVYLEQKED